MDEKCDIYKCPCRIILKLWGAGLTHFPAKIESADKRIVSLVIRIEDKDVVIKI